MEALKDTAEDIADHTGDLLGTYYKLFLINAADKGGTVVSVGVAAIVIMILGIIVMLFGGVGLAWWIGEGLQNMKAGFFITGGIFLFVLALCLALRKRFIFPLIRNAVISKLYE
jgi:hypothetical protein